jgi:uncharacterized protein YciI
MGQPETAPFPQLAAPAFLCYHYVTDESHNGKGMMAQFLYRIQPTRLEMLTVGPTPQEEQIISQHFNYLKNLTEQGVVILVGRTQNNDERTFGIAIFNANSDEDARRIMDNDPAVQNGVMRAELFPYRVALIAERNVN